MARPRSPRGQGDRLRDELLDATEQLLTETGDERAVTIRAVVDRVGVTPPTLYRHFADKHALVGEAVARRFAALGTAIATKTAPAIEAGDPAGALHAGCLAYLDWARNDPGGYALLFTSRRDTFLPGGPSGTEAFEALAEGIAACQQAGLAHDGDPRELGLLLWAALHGIATLSTSHAHIDWPDTHQIVTDLLSGLTGLPGPPRPPGHPGTDSPTPRHAGQ